MTFFQKLFGYRSKLAASSSLSFGAALDQATAICADLKDREVDVMWLPVKNTNSMVPTFDQNAVVILEKCPFSALREGDIVTYKAPAGLVIHRLNERKKDGWTSIGDGNTSFDSGLVQVTNFDRRVMMVIYAQKLADTDR